MYENQKKLFFLLLLAKLNFFFFLMHPFYIYFINLFLFVYYYCSHCSWVIFFFFSVNFINGLIAIVQKRDKSWFSFLFHYFYVLKFFSEQKASFLQFDYRKPLFANEWQKMMMKWWLDDKKMTSSTRTV